MPNMMYKKNIIIHPERNNMINTRFINTRFILPKLESDKLVYRFVRFTSVAHNDLIHSCGLEYMGSLIDFAYKEIFTALRNIYGIKDNTMLPFAFCRDNKYFIPGRKKDINIYIGPMPDIIDNFTLSVDIYEMIEPLKYDIPNIIVQQQFTGFENLAMCGKYKLNFNHIVNYIIIDAPKCTIERFILHIDNFDTDIDMKDIIYYNNQYIIPFTKSLDLDNFDTFGVNFSGRNVMLMLWLKSDDENVFIDPGSRVGIFAVNYNGFTDKSGLSFTG